MVASDMARYFWVIPKPVASPPEPAETAPPCPTAGPLIFQLRGEQGSKVMMRERQDSKRHSTRPSGLTDLSEQASVDIAAALNGLLADVFALYLKTKNFHWHMSGPHFRDYHLLLDEQASQVLGMTDPIAERVRKIGGTTIRSVGQVARLQRITDNDAEFVEPWAMLAELRDDNLHLTAAMRHAHDACAQHGDVATTSQLEVWIDEAERRSWFLYEATRQAPGSNG
jgi:starvation-inducible DNA-binding protein